MKKMHNHIIYELLALLVLLGIFFVLFNGIYKSENPDNDEYTVSVDSLYINDCMKIIGYKQGVNSLGWIASSPW